MSENVVEGRPVSMMKVGKLCCELNMPKGLESRYDENAKELSHSLPAYNKRPAYLVDEYPACPENWMRSSGDISSYFMAVKDGHGMWLDFNGNSKHTHHIAAVISMQGINAITGQEMTGARLEQYKHKCPVHDIDFGHERYCEKCDYKWPPQNYITTTATPNGLFWLDGFRGIDGMVRQYLFTKDTERGVAAQLIGDRRVYAIGIAFFLSKEPKPPKPVVRSPAMGQSMLFKSRGNLARSAGFSSLQSLDVPEIAAGAKIRQQVYKDDEGVVFYHDECAGQIVVNYLFEEGANAIIQAGHQNMDGSGEGFMANLKVGNPFATK